MLDGIINIKKERGYTSHDVVAVLRRITGQKKIGHTGTLDPEAEGVLPVCFGRATKVADYVMAAEKEYQAELCLGITTTTEDATGEVLQRQTVRIDQEELLKALPAMKGTIWQTPPMYSAIKVGGKKLYELAREGKEIERKKRKIEIFSIRLLSFTPPDRAEIWVHCSKGTYIRTLCADIGTALGCGAHMGALTRTRSGRFTLENAVTLSQVQEKKDQGQIETLLIPLEEVLKDYPAIQMLSKGDKWMENGAKLRKSLWAKTPPEAVKGMLVRGYNSQGILRGLYLMDEEQDGGLVLRPKTMLL